MSKGQGRRFCALAKRSAQERIAESEWTAPDLSLVPKAAM
jgi:hypothetical protein